MKTIPGLPSKQLRFFEEDRLQWLQRSDGTQTLFLVYNEHQSPLTRQEVGGDFRWMVDFLAFLQHIFTPSTRRRWSFLRADLIEVSNKYDLLVLPDIVKWLPVEQQSFATRSEAMRAAFESAASWLRVSDAVQACGQAPIQLRWGWRIYFAIGVIGIPVCSFLAILVIFATGLIEDQLEEVISRPLLIVVFWLSPLIAILCARAFSKFRIRSLRKRLQTVYAYVDDQ